MSELKPCPFCGASGEDDIDAHFALSGTGEVAAGCMKCGACGPMADSAEESALRWNERVEPLHAAAGEAIGE